MSDTENSILIAERETKGSKSGFIDSITVWINKPHVVNRRLCGTKIGYFSFVDIDQLPSKLIELKKSFSLDDRKCDDHETSTVIHETDYKLIEIETLNGIPDDEAAVVTRKLIPKQCKQGDNISEIIVIKDEESLVKASFFSVPSDSPEKVSYQIVFVPNREGVNKIQLKKLLDSDTKTPVSENYKAFDWMKNTLLPKLCNWSGETKLKTSVTSLRLVPIEDYSEKYKYLKDKYGKHFVENWPESTDPQKFVYEDIAIASYLLVLWQKEREKKQSMTLQSFVDLGCGNGLLVHLLSSEGHPGIGLDIRKRKIWEIYGDKTKLKEMTFTPSSENTFPEYDWLIGNHSDELTPWIPVIAARSSFTCRYFVLPCCHYDFDCKFSSKQPGLSNYRTYLNFVKEVGEVCGFKVEEDALRIPSTKRVCFIGQDRTYSKEEEELIDDRRSVYITTRSKSNKPSISCAAASGSDDSLSAKYQKLNNGQKWSSDFEPREQSKEKSRNCQHIAKEVKTHIINIVFQKVLESDKSEIRHLPDGRTWTKGGILPLSDVIKLFDREIMKQLKSECGGLQTLLKNHNNIFNVSGGTVQLRDLSLKEPYSKKSQLSKKDRSQYFKTLHCWFYTNHPDGCPRTEETCTFAHGDNDLKSKLCDRTVLPKFEN